MPASGLHHVDLALRDLERSFAFYTAVYAPLRAKEAFRYPSYRGTEEVVHLHLANTWDCVRQTATNTATTS